MTPTQYQFLTQQLGEVKESLLRIESRLARADELLTRHDEQLALVRKGSASALVLAGGVALAWLKATFHI